MKANIKGFFLFTIVLGLVQGITIWLIFGDQNTPLKLLTAIISMSVIGGIGMALFILKKEKK